MKRRIFSMILVAVCMLFTACEDNPTWIGCNDTHHKPDGNPLPLDTTGYNSVAVILSNFRYVNLDTIVNVKVEAFISSSCPCGESFIGLTDDPNHGSDEVLCANNLSGPFDTNEDGKIRLKGYIGTGLIFCDYIPLFYITDIEPIDQ